MHGLIWPEYAVRRSWKVLRLHRWTDIGTRFHILAFYLEGRRSQWKVLSKFNDQLSSVAQSCLTLCDPMDCSMPGLPGHHQLPEFTQTHVHWVGDAIQHLILCCPLLLPPSVFPSIRVFSSESVLHIRWPKYWSFSLSISPSNEHLGLVSFRMDWLDLLAVQGTLKSLLQHHSKLSWPNFKTHSLAIISIQCSRYWDGQ